jgi:CelD/BcsL family acetyltransferase involved in cellulose biosynthesis
LCLYRKGHLKIISFPDLGVSDYTGPVFAPGSVQTPQAARAMMAEVLSVLPACDLVQFLKLPERIDGESNPLFWLKGVALMPDEECFGVLLRQDWASQAEEIMDRPLLSTIRRRRAQIAKLGVVIYDRISDPRKLVPVWESLVGMRRERFLKLGREDLLVSPVWQRFYKSLLTRSDRTLDVSIARMTVSEETIASCFGITRGSTYYMLIPTFQMGKWERYVPGMQLFYEMMRTQAAASGGYFDFTIGGEGYKSRVGAKRHSLYEWRKPLSVKGTMSYSIWRGKVALRRHPKLLSLAQNIRATFCT